MLMTIKISEGADWAMLSFIFTRTIKATNIITVNPAADSSPIDGK